jgi:hypothetical protein
VIDPAALRMVLSVLAALYVPSDRSYRGLADLDYPLRLGEHRDTGAERECVRGTLRAID